MKPQTNKFHESIVLVGGGGGVFRIASSLKHIRPNITTIQTVFDNGGHSARLRLDRGVLPPGDIRQAILALSDDSGHPLLRKLLAFRFSKKNGSSLDDATVGNIMLTALTEITGSLPVAIDTMCHMFRVTGRVLPVSLDDAQLTVTLSDGTVIEGEGQIDTRSVADSRTIVSASLKPRAHIYCRAYEAIASADKIIFCPGDFWTSLVPNLLVESFRDALKETKAKSIFVTNIMTKKSETDRYTTATFAQKLCEYTGLNSIHAMVSNDGTIPSEILARYESEQARPVIFAKTSLVKQFIRGDLVDLVDGVIRHHNKVASIIAEL